MGKHRYGVILDAGSSGSRVYVYRWLNAQAARAKGDTRDLNRLPEVKTKKNWRLKVHPGISTFGPKPEQVGPEHLKELVEFALDIVPEDEVENTPIFLLATAGMRLLPAHQRTAVLEQTCTYFRQNSKFQLPDCDLHIQVIPGETEGLYGWIAANYLLGGFDQPEPHDHEDGHSTYGFLDMGGASAQIAFAPNATEAEKHAEDLKLLRLRTVGGKELEYRVFVTTWLGFGANEARRRYVEQLLQSYPNDEELPDPCLPVGLQVHKNGTEIASGSLTSKQPHLIGTGSFPECLKRTFPLLEKERHCDDAPCLLNGQHTPAIDFDVNHFVGVSEYWHTTHEVFAMAHKDKAYDFHTYQKQVTDFCSRDWVDIEKDVAKQKWGKKVDKKTVEEVCFKASWLINMLHDGIGVPRVGLEPTKDVGKGSHNQTKAVVDKAKEKGFLDPFQAVDKIDGTEVSWTLGKMVMYASSQIPPADAAGAVGFGTNKPGEKLPLDFQYAGGKDDLLPGDKGDTTGLDWHDRIFNEGYEHRVPGILIFMLILVLAVYLLCGRERRQSIYHKVVSLVGRRSGKRKGGILGGKIFGSGSPSYDRVMEEADPDDFELGSVDSDEQCHSGPDAESPRTGRSSGWATPAHRGLSPDFSRTSPKTRGYFDVPAALTNSGLGITPFERGGLVVRTESKERMAPQRTRAASPGRKSPLITPFKENVD
ncbi:Golgi apyrase [Teratosphaeria destructans]|uniref:Golgi apyrase n=1 Tax=Teratosphaeria destructans TaxID=418781 RepID=A0A9W7SSL1_9PEZI|nr:Golgi apyrase [Teratosphaeria destructans]